MNNCTQPHFDSTYISCPCCGHTWSNSTTVYFNFSSGVSTYWHGGMVERKPAWWRWYDIFRTAYKISTDYLPPVYKSKPERRLIMNSLIQKIRKKRKMYVQNLAAHPC